MLSGDQVIGWPRYAADSAVVPLADVEQKVAYLRLNAGRGQLPSRSEIVDLRAAAGRLDSSRPTRV